MQRDFDIFHGLLFEAFLCVFDNIYLPFLGIEKTFIKNIFKFSSSEFFSSKFSLSECSSSEFYSSEFSSSEFSSSEFSLSESEKNI